MALNSLKVRSKEELVKGYNRAKGMIEKYKDEATRVGSLVLASTEINGAAYAAGFARGRFSDDKGQWLIADTPPELAAGGLLQVAAIAGLFGKDLSPHVNAVGAGFSGAYLSHKGYEFGLKAKDKAAKEGDKD